ncbi:Obg family GTPase CgtA, partial [Candidatus Poribacteria bacterium]|nr:Obg family GTPase CgtA [Candidatus Poribacteria bacterium]
NINAELNLYDPGLSRLPQIIAANKMDLPIAETGLQMLKEYVGDTVEIIPVSAATGQGLEQLVFSAWNLLENTPDIRDEVEPEQEIVEYNKEHDSSTIITREDSTFTIHGRAVRRAVVMTDMKNQEALALLHYKLKQMGVIKALKDAGAKEGDTVVVNDVEFILSY